LGDASRIGEAGVAQEKSTGVEILLVKRRAQDREVPAC